MQYGGEDCGLESCGTSFVLGLDRVPSAYCRNGNSFLIIASSDRVPDHNIERFGIANGPGAFRAVPFRQRFANGRRNRPAARRWRYPPRSNP